MRANLLCYLFCTTLKNGKIGCKWPHDCLMKMVSQEYMSDRNVSWLTCCFFWMLCNEDTCIRQKLPQMIPMHFLKRRVKRIVNTSRVLKKPIIVLSETVRYIRKNEKYLRKTQYFCLTNLSRYWDGMKGRKHECLGIFCPWKTPQLLLCNSLDLKGLLDTFLNSVPL